MISKTVDGISVIICCYNSSWIIGRCLDALKKQIVGGDINWEVVLVDNNCSDNTVEIANASLNTSGLDYTIVQESKSGLLNARKRGIKEVKYAYAIFCDDDNLLCPDYVDTMYQILSANTKVGAAGGKGIAEFECEPDPRIMSSIQGYAVGSQMQHKDFLFGAGLAVRTELVREIYENQRMYLTGRMGKKLLAGDDTELTMSILLRGFRLQPTDGITYVHVLRSNRLTWEYKQQMFAGFKQSVPALMAMRGALNNINFYHACMTNYFMAVLLFIQHSLLFWREGASEQRRKSGTRILNFHLWGFVTLKRIYDQWIKIKSKNEIVNNYNML